MVSIQRHLLNLRAVLQAGEAERAWIGAERLEHQHVGALMVTNRRLLFSGLGFFAPSLEAVPLAAVRRPEVAPAPPKPGPFGRLAGARAVLRADVLGDVRRWAGRPGDVQRLLGALRGAMADAGLDPDAADAGGLAAELERLAALHGFGVLTDDEFAAAKQALLTRPSAD